MMPASIFVWPVYVFAPWKTAVLFWFTENEPLPVTLPVRVRVLPLLPQTFTSLPLVKMLPLVIIRLPLTGFSSDPPALFIENDAMESVWVVLLRFSILPKKSMELPVMLKAPAPLLKVRLRQSSKLV